MCNVFVYTHYIKCEDGQIKTHRSYISETHTCKDNYSELHGTSDIQNLIFNNQNPSSCKNQKYLIVPNWPFGFGASIHVMGCYLALAINTNRLLLIQPTLISKYFEPLTNCSKYNDEVNIKVSDRFSEEFSENPFENKKYVLPKVCNFSLTKVPKFVTEYLNSSFISLTHINHFWRNQAVKYIYHLKNNTTKIINKSIIELIKCNFNCNNINLYPCINVWVRHGDKAKEMKLIDTEKYFIAIDLFKRISNAEFAIYLSTDDRNAINTFLKSKYKVFYLNYSRVNDGNNHWKKNHMYNILSDIELSLKCISSIGTRHSNINRLIDEIRSTSTMYRNIPFFEVGIIQHTNSSFNNLEVPEY